MENQILLILETGADFLLVTGIFMCKADYSVDAVAHEIIITVEQALRIVMCLADHQAVSRFDCGFFDGP